MPVQVAVLFVPFVCCPALALIDHEVFQDERLHLRILSCNSMVKRPISLFGCPEDAPLLQQPRLLTAN